MPDLQSELSKIVNEWETPVEEPQTTARPTAFKATTNVTRACFDMVINNPGILRTEAIRKLETQGYPLNSTSSIFSQMVRQGLVRKDGAALYALTREYTPLKSARSLKPASKTTGLTVAKQATPAPKETPVRKENPSPDDLLQDMSVLAARALYDRLKEIFG